MFKYLKGCEIFIQKGVYDDIKLKTFNESGPGLEQKNIQGDQYLALQLQITIFGK